jgi:MerR family transcriptional regulator, redox-sensitive transcriptional activator SoxR
MDTLAIGEVAAAAGVATSTIRYYERIGLLPPARRVAGQRRYDADILHALTLIRLGKAAGFSLAELRTFAALGGTADAPAWRSLVAGKLDEVRARRAQLEAMERLLELGLACGCLDITECARVEGVVSRTRDAS